MYILPTTSSEVSSGTRGCIYIILINDHHNTHLPARHRPIQVTNYSLKHKNLPDQNILSLFPISIVCNIQVIFELKKSAMQQQQ